MLFKIDLTFDTREDAQNLLELLKSWTMTDLHSLSENNYPRESYAVTSIQEIEED